MYISNSNNYNPQTYNSLEAQNAFDIARIDNDIRRKIPGNKQRVAVSGRKLEEENRSYSLGRSKVRGISNFNQEE